MQSRKRFVKYKNVLVKRHLHAPVELSIHKRLFSNCNSLAWVPNNTCRKEAHQNLSCHPKLVSVWAVLISSVADYLRLLVNSKSFSELQCLVMLGVGSRPSSTNGQYVVKVAQLFAHVFFYFFLFFEMHTCVPSGEKQSTEERNYWTRCYGMFLVTFTCSACECTL